MPTDGVEFDLGDGGGEIPTDGSIPVAVGSNYNPPPPRSSSALTAKDDPESALIHPTMLGPSSPATSSQVADLLDDRESEVTGSVRKSEIDELD